MTGYLKTEPADVQLERISCAGCGYQLAGLQRDGVCPECAYPIERSIAAAPTASAGAAPFRVFARSYVTDAGVFFLVPSLYAAIALLVLGAVARMIAVSQLASTGQHPVRMTRARYVAFGVVSALHGAIGAAALTIRPSPWTVALAWMGACLASAVLIEPLARRTAAKIHHETVLAQLRSQRTTIYVAAAVAVAAIAAIPWLPLALVIRFAVILGCALGVIAIGHTVVALSTLSRTMVAEEAARRVSSCGVSGSSCR